jgi:hypothetical protein
MVKNMAHYMKRTKKETEVGKGVLGVVVGAVVLPALFGAALNLGGLVVPVAIVGAVLGLVAVEYFWKK